MSTLILNDTTPIQELSKVPVSTFLPLVADCVAIVENFMVLASQVIVDNFPHLLLCVIVFLIIFLMNTVL